MAYWTSIYSVETWDRLLSMPNKFIGASKKRWSTIQKIKVGDIIFAYVTGISRYVAIMEVTGAPFKDESIFGEGYPYCAPVKILLQLDLEHAVPVKELQ
ncbi:MAG: EVE domain-containing protein, partial [Chloroflexi bacterium]